ncbi:YdcF family protein [Pedobacter ginsengiterrae]|uniref:YdcF family protein n=1 Tax=Pedobacter ginsengiterrae TaxID=871696 RepID=A0ABP7P7G8_9SPHI
MFLLKPILWICLLLILAVCKKYEPNRKRLLFAALALLIFFSNAFIVGKIFNFYESGYPQKDRKYDVAIVLGGFSGLNKRNNKIAFGSSGDRLFQAIELYKNGKIGKILLSSGSSNLIDKKVKEADLAVAYLKLIGIPDSTILIENQSRNTIENAKFSLALIEKQKPQASVLVITSAWHIPRTKLIFNKQSKNKLDYYPTDFRGVVEYEFGDFIIPNASALGSWEILLKEWVGYVVDGIRS